MEKDSRNRLKVLGTVLQHVSKLASISRLLGKSMIETYMFFYVYQAISARHKAISLVLIFEVER